MKFNKQMEVTSSIGSINDVSELISQCLEEKVTVDEMLPSPFEDALCFRAKNKKIILMASYDPDESIKQDAFKNLLDYAEMHKNKGPVILALFNLKGETGYGRCVSKMKTYYDDKLVDDTWFIEICVQDYVERYLKGDKAVAQKYPNILALEPSSNKILDEIGANLEQMKANLDDKEFYKRLIKGLLKRGITPQEIKDLTGLSLKEIEKYQNMLK